MAYKYAVTQDEDDRQRALHRFYAIAFLHNITGIKGAAPPASCPAIMSATACVTAVAGMVARSALKQSAPPPGRQGEKWYSSIHP